jgi:hypothetical protein
MVWFAKTGRKYSWPAQMTKEDSVLEVVWYETLTRSKAIQQR